MRSTREHARGFSLMELIIALGVFLAMSSFIYSFIDTGLRLWEEGERRGTAYEAIQAIITEMKEDFQSIYIGGPSSHHRFKFLCDYKNTGGEGTVSVPRLRFVRTLKGEMKNRITRKAGTRVGAKGYYDLFLDMEEEERGGLLPPQGFAEVLYTLSFPRGGEGAGVLLKGVRSPPGGEGSFFQTGTLLDEGRLWQVAHPLVGGVLYAAFQFELEGSFSANAFFDSWDSTRGILGEGPLAFALYRGEGSANDPKDDVYPRRVRATLVLQQGEAGHARLLEAISAQDVFLEVGSPTSIPNPKGVPGFLKIGEEWVSYSGKEGHRIRLMRRGERGTAAVSHSRGSQVLAGQTFTFDILIPCNRGLMQ